MSAEITKPLYTIRRLGMAYAAAYRELRLEGLRSRPEAFGAAWEEEVTRPLDWFAERLERNAVLGGSLPGGPALAGTVGLVVPEAAKMRHRGTVMGMFVRPEAEGTGLATALIARLLDHAAQVVEEVHLTVGASNTKAVRLYARAGFRQYALVERGLKVGEDYHDELLMALKLPRFGQAPATS
jgi:RimJ/RimL family protein N-acetyltransferase